MQRRYFLSGLGALSACPLCTRRTLPRVTAYAKILHVRCIGSVLSGALGGGAAAGHTTCAHHYTSSHVEGLIPLPHAAGLRADMRGGVGERTSHRAVETGTNVHR